MASEVEMRKLQEELEEEIEKNKSLEKLIADEEQLVSKLTKELEAIQNGEPDSMWYMKYKAQHDENTRIEESIKALEQRLVELRGHIREVEGQEVPVGSPEDLSENDLRLYLKKLERRKHELQGELKDCEWRLDQESIGLHRAQEEVEATSTELSEVLANTADAKSRKSRLPPGTHSDAPSRKSKSRSKP